MTSQTAPHADIASSSTTVRLGSSAPPLRALTTLRFVAALLVVVHHLKGHLGISSGAFARFTLSQGVSFFFVLSGFVLTYVHPQLEAGKRLDFLRRRFARLWPAHLASLVLLWALWREVTHTLHGPWGPAVLAANIAMVHAWIPIQAVFDSFNGPSWSISAELGLYLCFLLLIPNWKRTWHLKLALTGGLAFGLITLCNRMGLRPDPGSPWTVSSTGLVYINPLARLFEFTLGMATALGFSNWRARLSWSRSWGTLLEILAVALAAGAMSSTHWMEAGAGQIGWVGKAGSIWLVLGGWVCIPFALLIWVMAVERGLLSRLLTHPLPVLLGEISFGVYLLHRATLAWFEGRWTRAFPSMSSWTVGLCWSIATLLGAYAMFVLVEKPGRRLLAGDRRGKVLDLAAREKVWLAVAAATMLSIGTAVLVRGSVRRAGPAEAARFEGASCSSFEEPSSIGRATIFASG